MVGRLGVHERCQMYNVLYQRLVFMAIDSNNRRRILEFNGEKFLSNGLEIFSLKGCLLKPREICSYARLAGVLQVICLRDLQHSHSTTLQFFLSKLSILKAMHAYWILSYVVESNKLCFCRTLFHHG